MKGKLNHAQTLACECVRALPLSEQLEVMANLLASIATGGGGTLFFHRVSFESAKLGPIPVTLAVGVMDEAKTVWSIYENLKHLAFNTTQADGSAAINTAAEMLKRRGGLS